MAGENLMKGGAGCMGCGCLLMLLSGLGMAVILGLLSLA